LAQVFFNKDKIMFEAACEPYNHCDNDQLAFKGLFARFIYATTKWLPDLYPLAQPYMQASAEAAAQQCDGTANGLTGDACGFRWTMGSQWDNTWGWGQQFDALEIIQGQLIEESAYPVTKVTGGISHGNPAAGTGGDFAPGPPSLTEPITTADKAGAGILTAFVVISWCSVIYWMV
jgi:mannan endo-1,6-alpha-mannosidase